MNCFVHRQAPRVWVFGVVCAGLPMAACEGSTPELSPRGDALTESFASDFDQICAVDDAPEECAAQFGGPNADPSCTTQDVALAAECTRDCLLPCGFNGLGLTSCNCAAGQFFSCECLRPASYAGDDTAPFCDQIAEAEGSRSLAALDGKPCETAFEQCVGDDPELPERNCACVPAVDPETRRFREPQVLSWVCADLTTRWFRLQAP